MKNIKKEEPKGVVNFNNGGMTRSFIISEVGVEVIICHQCDFKKFMWNIGQSTKVAIDVHSQNGLLSHHLYILRLWDCRKWTSN